MRWNHRVIKVIDKAMGVDEEWYAIHEVYYNEDGMLAGYAERPATVGGESVEELRTVLEQMLRALDETIIDKTDTIRNE